MIRSKSILGELREIDLVLADVSVGKLMRESYTSDSEVV